MFGSHDLACNWALVVMHCRVVTPWACPLHVATLGVGGGRCVCTGTRAVDGPWAALGAYDVFDHVPTKHATGPAQPQAREGSGRVRWADRCRTSRYMRTWSIDAWRRNGGEGVRDFARSRNGDRGAQATRPIALGGHGREWDEMSHLKVGWSRTKTLGTDSAVSHPLLHKHPAHATLHVVL